ncbi:MAG TPA: TonB-dependent receptor [Prolixibacteraceae bacterium]|nr:TonB-dependent receptor [Prolixibacteraceae bacterium]
MKKKRNRQNLWYGSMPNFLLKMKLLSFLIFVTVATVTANSYSQQTKFNMNFENVSVRKVFQQIEENSEFILLYSEKSVDVERKVNVEITNQTVDKILDQVFMGTKNYYEIHDRQIAIMEKGSTEKPLFMGKTSETQQQKSISGKVTDSSGASLPGVSVVVKGTTTGVITDIDGKYTLTKVPENATLQFSFVGMKGQEVAIGNKSSISVVMAEEAIGIDEVVAVGYGTQKKVNLTGSVSSVNGEKLKTITSPNTALLLQGRLPGVTVISGGAQPGKDDPQIRIRGIGTLGNNNPMVIVDGVETSFNQISSNDIETISVLKDAASASIYGVRAANGVILITTKQGIENKMNLNFNSTISFSNPTVIPSYVNSSEWAQLYNESVGQEIYSAEMIQKLKDGSDPDHFANTYWPDEIFRTGILQKNYIGVSGGSSKSKYMVSIEYLNQEGMMKGTSNDRLNFRSNVDFILKKNIKGGVKLSGSRQRVDEPSDGTGGDWGIMRKLYWFARPTVPVKHANGHWGYWDGNPLMSVAIDNPAESVTEKENYQELYRFNSQAFLSIDFLKNFNFKTQVAGKFNHELQSTFIPQIPKYNAEGIFIETDSNNSLTNKNNTGYMYQIENILSYSKNLGNHSISGLAGQSAQNSRLDFTRAYIEGFPNNEMFELGAGVKNPDVGGSATQYTIQSFFGRLNYILNDRYLFEFNVRRDGSSKMPKINRYGIFPSMSTGWIISEEKFLKTIPFIPYLKIRGSWGKLGNQEIGDYAYSQYVALGRNYLFGGNLTPGAAQTSLANSEIKWESTVMTNFGLDISFFNGNLNLTGDYFIKRTSDILLQLPINATLGNLTPPYQNAGEVENKGWELDLSYSSNQNRDFQYSVSGNISKVKNKIIDLKGLEWISQGGIFREGDPIGAYYGFLVDGIYQSQQQINEGPVRFNGLVGLGDLIYRDISGPDGTPDGKVDGAYDRTIIGSPFPDWTYSFNSNLSYKNFSLSLFFQGVLGADRYFREVVRGNVTQKWLERWTKENPSTTMPRLNGISNDENSDFWLMDASYLRLKNIEFGYNLPQSICKKVKLENVRFYASGTNLVTFTKIKDWDPEKFADDSENFNYPHDKTYSLGINVNF